MQRSNSDVEKTIVNNLFKAKLLLIKLRVTRKSGFFPTVITEDKKHIHFVKTFTTYRGNLYGLHNVCELSIRTKFGID